MLSFDGKGINGPDDYKTRVATFTNDVDAQRYGNLFAYAEELQQRLKAFVEPWQRGGNWETEINYETYNNARRTIAKSEGREN